MVLLPGVARSAVFIGSSGNGLDIANHLQPALQRGHLCEATVWTQGVFKPSSFTMPSLVQRARDSDFAVLVATPDDAIVKKDEQAFAPRDNVVLELGLFMGALGLDRVFLVADFETHRLTLPSDLGGYNWVEYVPRDDGNQDAAVGPPALAIRKRIEELGPRGRPSDANTAGPQAVPKDADAHELSVEIARLCMNAQAQGWRVRTTDTTLRLESTAKGRFSFSYAPSAEQSREELRNFAAQVRAGGLRVNRTVRRPIVDRPV